MHDEDDELAMMAMNYLATHKAVAHAPGILDRMLKTEKTDLAAAGLRALTTLRYEDAADLVYEDITGPGDVEYVDALIDYSGEVRTEHGRLWLREAVAPMTAESYHEETDLRLVAVLRDAII